MTEFDRVCEKLPKEVADFLYKSLVENGLSKDDPMCSLLLATAFLHQAMENRRSMFIHWCYGLVLLIAAPLFIWLGYSLKPVVYSAPDGHFTSSGFAPNAQTAICFTPSHGKVDQVWTDKGHLYITLAP